MTDLIRRNDAIDILCKLCGITEGVEKCRKTSADGWCKEYCELKNMPTVDAIPVEWIRKYIEEYPYMTASSMLHYWSVDQALERKAIERKEGKKND